MSTQVHGASCYEFADERHKEHFLNYGSIADTAPTLRRMRPYYAPSYSTYPPSIMNPSRTYRNNVEKRYPIALRVVIKIAEVVSRLLQLLFVVLKESSLKVLSG